MPRIPGVKPVPSAMRNGQSPMRQLVELDADEGASTAPAGRR